MQFQVEKGLFILRMEMIKTVEKQVKEIWEIFQISNKITNPNE